MPLQKVMDNTEKQHRHQNHYFNREFAAVRSYHLAPWQQSYINKITSHLLAKDSVGKNILDIATGSGYVAIEMAKRGLNVTASDLSIVAIKNLKKYRQQFSLKNLNIIKCPAEKIPLADNSFDYIIANAILEHIFDENKAINEWLRLLKPNGQILVTIPLMYRYIWPFLWPINYIHDKRIGHLRRYNSTSLQSKFHLDLMHVFYTGHLVKVIGAAINAIFPLPKLVEYCEIKDDYKQKIAYGANNIVVIMKKTKQ